MRFAIVLGVAIAATSSPAVAGDWRIVSVGDELIVGMDADSLSRSIDRATGWTVSILKPSVVGPENPVAYIIRRNEFECSQERFRYLTTIYYSLEGERLASEDLVSDWEYAVPDTINGAMVAAACEGFPFDDGTETALDFAIAAHMAFASEE